MPDSSDVPRRLAEIRRRIAAACERAGRSPQDVTLVGASKLQPPAKLRAAYEAGLRVFGENRVQEAAAKAGELPAEIEWHLIGPLQSNKAKAAAELFAVIQSVDRLKIARVLDREAERLGRRIPCFIEVNLGGEGTKHGFPAGDLTRSLEPLRELIRLDFLGLMAIPPPAEDPEGSRPWFRRLRELRDALAATPGWERFPGLLSMGMSHDFEVAVEEGATHVRVGTALFGPRPE